MSFTEDSKENISLKVLCEIQQTTTDQKEKIICLKEHFHEVGFEEFSNEFLYALLYIQLNADYKTANVHYDQVRTFCRKFLIAFEKFDKDADESLTTFLLDGLVEYHNSSSGILRYRICEFINMIFNIHLECLQNLDWNSIENIREAMLIRTKDMILSIRLQALNVLQYLQEPENPDDPTIKAYIENITCSQVKVRQMIVKVISVTSEVIPHIICRCRDVNEKVRMTAYYRLVEIPAQALTIVQRQSILRNGFRDESQAVRKCIQEKLLAEWLKNYEFDFFKLILAVLLDGSEDQFKESKEIAENILSHLFRLQSITVILEQLALTDKLIPTEKLTWEAVLYWRCLITYLHSDGELEQYLEQIIPETVSFCNYILSFYKTKNLEDMKKWEYNNVQMILLELITIAVDCDISDECARKYLRDMLIKFLKEDVSEEVVRAIFIFLNRTMPVVEMRVDFICELISDIRNPLESNFCEEQYAQYEKETNELREQINKLLDNQRNAVNEQNFQLAEKLKEDISQLKSQLDEINKQQAEEEQVMKKNDPKTILKCTNIAIEMLQSPQIHKLTNSLKTLTNEILQDMLIVKIPTIQAKVMKCYALLSYFDKESAKISVKLFSSALLSYRDKSPDMIQCLLIVSICSIVDLILLYGSDIFPNDEITENLNSSGHLEQVFTTASYIEVVQIIISMMDDMSPVIRENAGLGVIKIMRSGRIHSPMLLSRLILKWFNPCTVQDGKFHQYLGNFLVNIHRDEYAAVQIEEAFIPTLHALAKAPESSPLFNIPGEKVAKFLVHLTSPELTKTSEIHKNIAQALCMEIESDITDVKANILYVRSLLMLNIDVSDEDFVEGLLIKCEELLDDLKATANTSLITKNLSKFMDYLKYNCSDS